MKFKPYSIEYWSDVFAKMTLYVVVMFAFNELIYRVNDMAWYAYLGLIIAVIAGIDKVWPKIAPRIPLWPYRTEKEEEPTDVQQ